jgi:sulfoxide reductase heme-binding subunit YedZ
MKTSRAPWLDRAGRFSPLKTTVLAALLLPGAWVALAYGMGALGPRPLNEVIHQTGLWAFRLLLISLAVSPARRVLEWPRLVLVRRMIGVAAFAYAASHLGAYAVDQAFDLGKVASEIALRFYLTIGFVALLGLSALAATSTDRMARRLGGRRWQMLHRLVYGIGVLAAVHYFLQTKAGLDEPLWMAGLFAWLMGYRLLARLSRAPGRLPIALLVALSAASAATVGLGEAGYYWVRMGVDPLRVLVTNLSLMLGVRPAMVVLLVGLAVSVAGALRVLPWRTLLRVPARPLPADGRASGD